jgi:DDE superfamily endonuclease
MTGDYLWHMEDVLAQSHRPHDPRHPLICFDERPCFLLEEVGALLPLSPGKAKRSHSEYKKNGSCCVFLAFEPHTGRRYVAVRDRRTAVDYAAFMQALLARYGPPAESLRLVQDNLNTHTPGACYEVLPPEQACALAQRFEPHYTPKKGSWLNRAESAFAALSKQCLARRIPEVEALRREVLAWADHRNLVRKTINWKFAQPDARKKLQRHYHNVQKFT